MRDVHPSELTEPALETLLSGASPCAIILYASWCPVCATVLPLWERVLSRIDGVTFGRMDVDAWPDVAPALALAEVPALVLARGGEVVFAEAGVLSDAVLENMLRELTNS